jgi:CRISPR system Cascade subunit CasC
MFIELHIIQNFPPSNLNRDDVGQPKEADFGGFRRARISSQCLKRAIRYAGKDPKNESAKSIFEQYTGVSLGKRTHLIVFSLRNRMIANGKFEEDATKVALEFARVYSSKKGKMNTKRHEETSVLLYMSESEFDEITKQLVAFDWKQLIPAIDAAKSKASKKDKEEGDEEDEEKANAKSPLKKMVDDWVRQTAKRPSAPDIALFGRMLADKPETNIDAACQVAHAISTHLVNRSEIDYFTAMDELKPKEESGAGFLDVAYFNSACFYRYARIDFEQLKKNLAGSDDPDLAYRSIEAFLRASEAAIPSGKKNSHAQECRPSLMLAVLRSDQSAGWSLVNAFEKPVNAKDENGLIEGSIRRLDEHFNHLYNFYDDDSVLAIAVALPSGSISPGTLSPRLHSAVKSKMSEWINAICDPLKIGAQ